MARTRKRRFLRGALLGWLAAYLFDPRLGHGRRVLTRDWLRLHLPWLWRCRTLVFLSAQTVIVLVLLAARA